MIKLSLFRWRDHNGSFFCLVFVLVFFCGIVGKKKGRGSDVKGVMETDRGTEGRVIRKEQLPNVCVRDSRYFK